MHDYNNKSNENQVKEPVLTWSQNWLSPAKILHKDQRALNDAQWCLRYVNKIRLHQENQQGPRLLLTSDAHPYNYLPTSGSQTQRHIQIFWGHVKVHHTHTHTHTHTLTFLDPLSKDCNSVSRLELGICIFNIVPRQF